MADRDRTPLLVNIARIAVIVVLSLGLVAGSYYAAYRGTVEVAESGSETPIRQFQQELDREILDLQEAAKRVETAAEAVYSGLETTKTLIGKTELRNQAIEGGRDRAKEKLQTLAERALEAQESGTPLTETEKRILRQFYAETEQ